MGKEIIATYHHSYAGGSKNTSRLLNYLSQSGCSVDAFFFERPQFFLYTSSNVKIHTLNSYSIHSEVIESSAIKNYALANQIFECIENNDKAILFGTNLFPYCDVLHNVKSQLPISKQKKQKLIIHPVGSDIWQIGPQIKSRVKFLLESPLVDSVITYSESFIGEIRDYYNIKREIHAIPPVLEKEKFFVLSSEEKKLRRTILFFQESDFLIHHHSSMRKIKCPESVIDIAIKATESISNNCFLLMTGPIPFKVIANLKLNLVNIGHESLFQYKTVLPNLTILWTGVLSNVENLLQISDVEINASLHDSFNISLMEAMACGVPVISSDIVGINSHIMKSGGGFCFPTNKLNFDELNDLISTDTEKNKHFDIDFAVDCLRSLAENKASAELMGRKGALYVSEEFSFKKVSGEFHKYLN